jgi:mannose-6-phosphate isomerase-like protein (cupin superfamily)
MTTPLAPAADNFEEEATMIGFVGAIEQLTLSNKHFRHVLFTADHTQLVVMSLEPGEEIGVETHAGVDQFFRIESGEADFVFDGDDKRRVHPGDGIVVPARTRHNVINASKSEPLKLYTIYSPPNHPPETVHATRADAAAAETAHGEAATNPRGTS